MLFTDNLDELPLEPMPQNSFMTCLSGYVTALWFLVALLNGLV